MEDVLHEYAQPYDPLRPLICFDERPCQLIGDIIVPIPMKPGKLKREDYEYKRNGTCCVLLAYRHCERQRSNLRSFANKRLLRRFHSSQRQFLRIHFTETIY